MARETFAVPTQSAGRAWCCFNVSLGDERLLTESDPHKKYPNAPVFSVSCLERAVFLGVGDRAAGFTASEL